MDIWSDGEDREEMEVRRRRREKCRQRRIDDGGRKGDKSQKIFEI